MKKRFVRQSFAGKDGNVLLGIARKLESPKARRLDLAHLVALRNADITGSISEFPVGTTIT
jgi:hypothetical protein